MNFKKYLRIATVPHSQVQDSRLLNGLMFKATKSTPGEIHGSKVVLCTFFFGKEKNSKLEYNITSPSAFINEHGEIEEYLEGLVDNIHKIGAEIVFTTKVFHKLQCFNHEKIDIRANQFFKKYNIQVFDNVNIDDLRFLSKSIGINLVNKVNTCQNP